MKDIAIAAYGLGKSYVLGGTQSSYHYKTLQEALITLIRRPFYRRDRRDGPRTFWALKDVSFEVKHGEVVGIIGRNGAGKSTLLKVLSRITDPKCGYADIYGRIGALLEVGTGFHPELTGRENIFLSGAILGMRRSEILRRFDEIVAFAEVEQFIDTPAKHYSSGMYMRLAFAVAAHLDTEILLVDEVLAVGDMAFQKKCLGKMGDVAQEGRTVLFVSHNMTAINQLCPRTIMLSDSCIGADGKTSEVVAFYLKTNSERQGERVWPDPQHAPGGEKIRIHAVRILSNGRVAGEVDIDKDVSVEMEFWNFAPGIVIRPVVYLLDKLGITVLSSSNMPSASLEPDEWFGQPYPTGLFRSTCIIPGNLLNDGYYHISVYLVTDPIQIEAHALQVLSFQVFDTGSMRKEGIQAGWEGVVRVRLGWRTEFIEQAN